MPRPRSCLKAAEHTVRDLSAVDASQFRTPPGQRRRPVPPEGSLKGVSRKCEPDDCCAFRSVAPLDEYETLVRRIGKTTRGNCKRLKMLFPILVEATERHGIFI